MSLRKRPYMKLYIAEYLADTTHLTTLEHGAYLLLLFWYWGHGSLPIDDTTRRKIAKCSTHRWPKIRAALEPLFECKNGTWRSKRLEHELAQVLENTVPQFQFSTYSDSELGTEYPSSSPSTSIPQNRKKQNSSVKNGDRNGATAPAQKPRHGQRSPRGRIWFDVGTLEFEAHSDNYRNAHHGLNPPMQWEKTGAWFEIAGETQ